VLRLDFSCDVNDAYALIIHGSRTSGYKSQILAIVREYIGYSGITGVCGHDTIAYSVGITRYNGLS